MTPTRNGNEDAVPKLPRKAVSHVGDIWRLGSHRLLCGDSTKQESYAKLLGDLQVAMVLTDPPYGVNYADINNTRSYRGTTRKDWGDIEGDENYDAAINALPLFISRLTPNGVAYIFTGRG